jgi:hypothetical protein
MSEERTSMRRSLEPVGMTAAIWVLLLLLAVATCDIVVFTLRPWKQRRLVSRVVVRQLCCNKFPHAALGSQDLSFFWARCGYWIWEWSGVGIRTKGVTENRKPWRFSKGVLHVQRAVKTSVGFETQ